MTFMKGLSGLTFAFALSASTAIAGELVLNSDQTDPAPKKAMEELIAGFRGRHIPTSRSSGTTSTTKATSPPSATS